MSARTLTTVILTPHPLALKDPYTRNHRPLAPRALPFFASVAALSFALFAI
jgi:hypothetical protein